MLALLSIGILGATPLEHWESVNRAAIANTSKPSSRASARRALDATLARVRTPGPSVLPRSAPRAVAASELAFPGRYDLRDRSMSAATKTAWQRFTDWVGDRLNALWKALFGNVHLGRTGAIVGGDIALILLVIGLIAVLVRVFISMQVDRSRRGGTSTPLERRASARALYLQACAFALEGAYEAAVQRLFLAALTALDLRGVLRENASATVGDIRRVLRSRDSGLVAAFDAVAAPFVDATYAETSIVAARWMQAKDAYDREIGTEEPA